MMQPDSQDVGGQVRDEIRLGIENLAQQGASIVGASDMLAEQQGQAGLGAIGDHFDGVDEMLTFGAQTSEAVFLRSCFSFSISTSKFSISCRSSPLRC